MEKKLAEKKRAAELTKKQSVAAKLVKLKSDAQARKRITDELRKRIIAQQARARELKVEAKTRKADAKGLAKKLAEQKIRAAKARRAAKMATAAKARVQGVAATSALPAVTGLRFNKTPRGGEIRIELSRSVSYEIVRTGARRIEMRLHGATIPSDLERTLDASALNGPIKLVSSFRDGGNESTVRVVVELAESAIDQLRVQDNALLWSFEPAVRRAGRPIVAQGPKAGAPIRPPTARALAVAKAARAAAKPSVQARRPSTPSAPAPAPTAQRTPPGVHAYPGMVAADGGVVGLKSGGYTAKPFMEGRKRRRKRKRKYSGKKINLTIKDADIQHVLTFLAKEGGVNIVASDDVKGKVTFHLENIPWDLALDMILKTQGYDYVREHGVFRVAPAESIQKEFEAELKRKQTIDELKPMVVRFVTVNYAAMDAVAEHIKTVLSKNGTVSADSSTSTLIIKDIEEHVQAAEDIVRRLDVQLPQVLIEARIVEASTSFSRDMGIQWGGDFNMSPAFGNPTGLAFPSVIGVRGAADDSTAPSSGIMDSSPNFAVNLPAAAGAGAGGALGLTLGSIGGAANVNLRLSAAEDEGRVKIISAPKILTIDGKKATISQGVSIPISVVSANGVNTQFFNADLKLEVMTSTSPDGNIRLDLDITKNEPDFGQTAANGAPTIQKKEAHTSLLVRDGDTTVIGGVYTRNTGSSSAQVPFISKIPILGWFFQNHRESDSRSELLIFITPRIANRRASMVDGGTL
jgi:type IV pilus assembly protein PilQ